MDRIDEFALQSQKEYGDFDGSITALDYRKFAELIINECIHVCRGTKVSTAQYNSGRLDCSVDIKNHFGVK